MAITKVTTPVTGFESAVDIGLKIPVGTNSNLPSGAEGMIRNDTDEDSGGNDSTTAITFYNGTDWRYFNSTVSTTPLENFNTVIWNGDATTTRSITGVGFDPDLVWVKKRSGGTARNHSLHDVVRGAGNRLNSNTTSAGTDVTNEVKSFINDGFTIGNGDEVNGSGSSQKYVAWCFKAGGLANRSSLFNGSSSYVNTSLVWPGNTTLSFSVWFKMDTINVSQYIIGDFNSGGQNTSTRFSISVTSTNLLQVGINNGGGGGSYPQFGSVASYINKWINVVVTVSGTEVKAYINGTQFGATTSQGTALAAGAQPFNVGAYGPGSNKQNFNGVISQVRFFTDVLTTGEVTQLYNETVANNSVLDYPTGTNCIAAYPLGINANNLSNNNNGTASNVTFDSPGYLTRNNDGTFESTVSVNDTLGFSIVTGGAPINGYPNTFGHGLGQKPDMIITKLTNTNSDWFVIFPKLSNALLKLNTIGTFTYDSFFAGTSTTLKTGYTGAAFDFVAYCFVSKPGFSKVGTYTGNGGNNPVDVGFEPAFVMIKNTTSNASWAMFDNKRTTANPSTSALYANESINEEDLRLYFQFTSTGFKNLQSSNTLNTSGWIYTYLAFA
jgi:hypothetical protein